MGGAADIPQRSSSPLKRRASDLEAEMPPSQQDDVDMIVVPSTDTSETPKGPTSSRATRAVSVDMLREEHMESIAGTPSSAEPAAEPRSSMDIPPIDDQIVTVSTLVKAHDEKQLEENAEIYLVSKKWLERVTARGSVARKTSKVEPEGDIGPVDNSDIVQQIIKDHSGKDFVQLKKGANRDDFELFPEEAWNMIVSWYGLMKGTMPIIRYAHNTNPDKTAIPHFLYEYHPPIFAIHRLWSDNNTLLSQKVKAEKPTAPIFVVSTSMRYREFLAQMKEAAQIEPTRKVRLWRVPRSLPAAEPIPPTAGAATPPSSRPSTPAPDTTIVPQREVQDTWKDLLLDVETFTKLQKGTERELIEMGDPTINPNYNGSMDLALIGLAENQALVLDEEVEKGSFVLTYVSPKYKAPNTRTGTSSFIGNSQPSSGRNSPAPGGYNTRGRAQKQGRVRGTVGLTNLGNTCYMNSALQCVRSVPELTKYFLSGQADADINYDNPLGNNGKVAEAYRDLLRDMYKDNSQPSIGPRAFKTTIGKHATQFSGYGQQDSQEFLGFLLDGISEDLCRIPKKPYLPKPDSTDEMVNNPAAIREMADAIWDISKQRDDSVILDLFTGLFKSTVVCPVCDKVSIAFDAFSSVSLPLPIETTWTHSVFYFPLNDKPRRLAVDLDKQASMNAFKDYVGLKVGVPAERLLVAEEFKSKVYKYYNDYEPASEQIGANDNVAVFELEAKPTNWPRPSKAKGKKGALAFGNDSDEEDVPSWDDPVAERMLVPVLYRRANPERGRFKKPFVMAPVPHFIVLTPEEARSEDIIRRKLLEKVVTFTTWNGYEDSSDENSPPSVAESIDPDLVITTGSDADSSGDGKVVAHSIDGEDEIVDVTMKEATNVHTSTENSTSPPSQGSREPIFKFNTARPKFMDPKRYLDGRFQHMFNISYFSGGEKEMMPNAWTAVDEDKQYPLISTRNPQVSQTVDETSATDYDMPTGRSTSDSSNDDEAIAPSWTTSTRMIDESSEEDELAGPYNKVLPVRSAASKSGVKVGFNNKRRNRALKTYSKKGNNRQQRKQPSPTGFDLDAPDDGPLVRLGEGLIVDWTAEAWDALFLGDDDNQSLGTTTWDQIEQLEDPELEQKRKARSARKKNGLTLNDCLNEYSKEEILSENDAWNCPRCKKPMRATKKIEIWRTPDILVLHLKRFSSSGTRRDKLDVQVQFPIDELDLSSRVIETQPGKQEKYELFAVDDHWGGLGGGHYTAFAKNFFDNEWYEYNDSSVSKQHDLSRMISPSAYLLFYRRKSDNPLGGPLIQQICNKFDNPAEASEDEDSGEDRRLVANSSLHGSSGALIGVEAARHQRNLGSDGEETTTISLSEVEDVPSYDAMENESDAAPLLGPRIIDEAGRLHASIEDEAIDMDLDETRGLPVYNQTWNFDAIGKNNRSNVISGTGSEADPSDQYQYEDDGRSDVPQHNSSASEGSIDERLKDFHDTTATFDDGTEFIDQALPVPDIVDDDSPLATFDYHKKVMQDLEYHRLGSLERLDQPEFEITADDEDEDEDRPATDIHVEEGEGLNEGMKMD